MYKVKCAQVNKRSWTQRRNSFQSKIYKKKNYWKIFPAAEWKILQNIVQVRERVGGPSLQNKHNRTTECFWCCYSCSSVWVDCLTDAGFSRRLQVSSADLSSQNLLIACQTFVHVYISLNWMKTAPKHSHAFAVKQNRWMFVTGGVRRLAKRDQRCSENREICEIEKSIGLNRAKLRSIATHL